MRLPVARKISPQVAIPACRALLTSNGCRVRIAAMPPTNAYPAHRNARSNAKEPNTSIAVLPSPVAPPAAQSRATTLHRAGCRRIGLCVAAGCCFILRRALGLHVLGYKAAIVRQGAFHQRLRLVDERVRQWLAAHIRHR